MKRHLPFALIITIVLIVAGCGHPVRPVARSSTRQILAGICKDKLATYRILGIAQIMGAINLMALIAPDWFR